jgi:hypothetical protein
MDNVLKLHEAIAVVLLNEENRTATFERIAEEIDRRHLYPNRKGGISLSKQVKLRTSIKSSRYKYWFEFTPPNVIRLI